MPKWTDLGSGMFVISPDPEKKETNGDSGLEWYDEIKGDPIDLRIYDHEIAELMEIDKKLLAEIRRIEGDEYKDPYQVHPVVK